MLEQYFRRKNKNELNEDGSWDGLDEANLTVSLMQSIPRDRNYFCDEGMSVKLPHVETTKLSIVCYGCKEYLGKTLE